MFFLERQFASASPYQTIECSVPKLRRVTLSLAISYFQYLAAYAPRSTWSVTVLPFTTAFRV